MNLVDVDAIERFICEAASRYARTCPQLVEYLDDAATRLTDWEPITIQELQFIGRLCERDGDELHWMDESGARNHFHHFAHQTGIAERWALVNDA